MVNAQQAKQLLRTALTNRYNIRAAQDAVSTIQHGGHLTFKQVRKGSGNILTQAIRLKPTLFRRILQAGSSTIKSRPHYIINTSQPTSTATPTSISSLQNLDSVAC